MPKMTPENERVVKGLERLIRIDERSKLEDIATSQHDEHEDNYGYYPDPDCMYCKEDGER